MYPGQALAIQGGALETSTPVQNNGATIVLQFNLSLFADPILTFASQRTSTGFGPTATPNVVAYSTDGASYTTLTTYSPPSSFGLLTFDFAPIDSLDGAATAFLRLHAKWSD